MTNITNMSTEETLSQHEDMFEFYGRTTVADNDEDDDDDEEEPSDDAFKYKHHHNTSTGFMDHSAVLDVDPQHGSLIHKARIKAEDSPTTTESFSPSASHALPANEGFSREQTLFFIDLMRQHLETEADGLPKTLKELNSRLKSARSNLRSLWKETAETLSSHFSESFCPDKVARKWNTLIEAYRKIKENNKDTGRGNIRFRFFPEMDELLAGQHDVVFPVFGSSVRLNVRPEVLWPSVVGGSLTEAGPASSTHTAPTRPHKRRRGQDDVLQFLRESEEASQRRHEEAQRRHEELLTQLKSAQHGFESLMGRLLEKL
ncbi:uncharacterized protein LOC114463086 isoform X3 [Gouania willdenowi]|uniref:uncharacterized protein LOC114463086 isoform X3 n=1 Tax=Gouania willdenowi TaxID=441366 RepID=UPI001054A2D4|nr:uncharacterized protein LOC114463086 isoform X3 [Gouania willdenowi]